MCTWRKIEGGREGERREKQTETETEKQTETRSPFRLVYALPLTYPHGPIVYIYNLAKVGYGI